MKLFPLLLMLCLVLAATAATPGCLAQSSAPAQSPAQPQDVHGLRIQPAPSRPVPTPFPLDAAPVAPQSLQFLTAENISPVDRSIIEASQSEIADRASRQGFAIERNARAWTYQQAVCPVLPQHLILQYSRPVPAPAGRGDISLFSVVIPRASIQGHIRIIPAQRRGYSLFTPVASNRLTVHDFNAIIQEEGSGLNPDWFTLALCYTALASGQIRAEIQPADPAAQTFPLPAPAQLRVSQKGGAEVWIADSTPGVRSMQWILDFAQNGHLLKVRHLDGGLLRERPVPGQVQEVKGVPVKEAAIDLAKP